MTVKQEPQDVIRLRKRLDTMEKMLNHAANEYGNKKALGTREILAEEDEAQPNGTVLRKVYIYIVLLQ